jgi:micrococcal nuclease
VSKRVRLFGIDTPESRTTDSEEKRYGVLAKHVLEERLARSNMQIDLHMQHDTDKFGRVLAELWQANDNVNQWLVDNHYAVQYFGLNKDQIKNQHLNNRIKLETLEKSVRASN